MPHFEGYSAWITVPGYEVCEYDTSLDSDIRRVTCWIPCEEGMKFSVHWRDHGCTIPTATYIKLDGHHVPGYFLHGKGRAERSSLRVGVSTVRPFMFARVPENAPGSPHIDVDTSQLGTIAVKIKRVTLKQKRKSNPPLIPRPPMAGKHTFGEPPVGIGFGPEEPGYVQMPQTWDLKAWNKYATSSFVTFIFRYRSREFLLAQGIMKESDRMYKQLPSIIELPSEPSPEPESCPPSPTESLPPTPTLSQLTISESSGSSSPKSIPSPMMGRAPWGGRSAGQPPRGSGSPEFPLVPPINYAQRSPPPALPYPISPPRSTSSSHREGSPTSCSSHSYSTSTNNPYGPATTNTATPYVPSMGNPAVPYRAVPATGNVTPYYAPDPQDVNALERAAMQSIAYSYVGSYPRRGGSYAYGQTNADSVVGEHIRSSPPALRSRQEAQRTIDPGTYQGQGMYQAVFDPAAHHQGDHAGYPAPTEPPRRGDGSGGRPPAGQTPRSVSGPAAIYQVPHHHEGGTGRSSNASGSRGQAQASSVVREGTPGTEEYRKKWCTPGVPIPKDLCFVESDYEPIPPPPPTSKPARREPPSRKERC